MEGKEVRFGIANSAFVRDYDNGCQLRGCERDARFLYAARRNDPARQHHAGGSHF